MFIGLEFEYLIISEVLLAKQNSTKTSTQESNITALPIHDAVLVSEIHVYKSKQVMEQVFLDMTNVPSVVKVE